MSKRTQKNILNIQMSAKTYTIKKLYMQNDGTHSMLNFVPNEIKKLTI